MAQTNPNNPSEILYGSSGDVRNEINSFLDSSFNGHYVDENDVKGSLIIRSLERGTRMINGYLEVVYSTQIPFTTASAVPVLLDDIAVNLATYYVLRASQARLANVSPDKRRDYYDDEVREEGSAEFPKGRLPMLRDRELQLPELQGAYADDVVITRKNDQGPIADLDDETNWKPDSTLIDDIEDQRK